MPPDPQNDVVRPSYGLWENTGWVIGTDGQPREDIQFVTEGAQPRAYIRKGGKVSFVVASVDATSSTLDTLRRLDMELVGEGAQHPDAISFIEKGYQQNFYLPHCGTNGITGVRGYNRILYPQVYAGVDMWVYSGALGQKMMFVIAPGSSPAAVQMQFTGQDNMDVDVNGWLRMQVYNKWFALPEAVAYQYDQNNVITPVTWGPTYLPNTGSGVVGFQFEQYDPTKPLVLLIGPPPPQGGPPVTDGVCWATYQGGDGYDQIQDMKYKDGEGLFACGWTNSSLTSFPATAGLLLSDAPEVWTITKFGLDDQLEWVTRYGSSSIYQRPRSLDFDPLGSWVFVGGYTDGADLVMPFQQPAGWHVQSTTAGTRTGAIAAFDRTLGQLFYATYFGQMSNVYNLDFDALGNLFFCGQTDVNLPAPNVDPPENATIYDYGGGGSDGFVARMNVYRQLDWTTFIGGDGADWIADVEAEAGKVVVVGMVLGGSPVQTIPTDNGSVPYFPSTVYQQDFFTQEFTTNGDHVWGSYFGYNGTILSTGYAWKGLAIDPWNGDIIVVGYLVNANTMPVTTNWPWYDETFTGGDGFIYRRDGTTKDLKYSSLVSGLSGAALRAIVIAPDGKQYICGSTEDQALAPHPAGDLCNTGSLLGNEDGILMVLSRDNDLLYRTLFGGNETTYDNDALQAVAVTQDGRLYFGGYTGAARNEDQDLFYPISYQAGAYWDEMMVGYRDGVVGSICGGDIWTGQEEPIAIDPSVCWFGQGRLHFPPLHQADLPMYLTDASGRLIWSTRSVRDQVAVALPELSTGLYFLQVPGALHAKFWKL